MNLYKNAKIQALMCLISLVLIENKEDLDQETQFCLCQFKTYPATLECNIGTGLFGHFEIFATTLKLYVEA